MRVFRSALIPASLALLLALSLQIAAPAGLPQGRPEPLRRAAIAPVVTQVSPTQAIAQLAEPLSPELTAIPTDPRKKPLEDIRFEDYQNHYTLNPDYTYSRTIATRTTLLTPSSLQEWQRASFAYYPDSQTLELVEAYVLQPDGSRVEVKPENVFTRPSQESQSAPGFDNSLTTTVVFPQLQVGSQTYVKWKFTQTKPSVVGFDELDTPSFRHNSRKETITLTLPKDLKLRWAKRGNYTVNDDIRGNQRIITAVMENYRGRQPENGMTSTLDVSPFFMVSNLDRWEAFGAIYWKQSQPKLQITPEVKALASQIVGNKTGLDAAREIYNWVTQNIQYVAVYLNESAGWVPNSVPTILKNGYGDCKDYVNLMQALLQARGIPSVPVLVDWGDQYINLPLPGSQFNHAMIYLPEYKLFANPTDKHAAFGELDTSLSGKFVVLGTETGQIAYTPATKAADNRYRFEGQLAIAPNGAITGQSQLQFHGQGSNSARNFFASDTPEQIAESLLSATPEGGYGVIKTSNLNDLNQPVTVKGTWTSPKAIALGSQAYFSVPLGLNVRNPRSLRGYLTYGQRLYPLMVGAETMEWRYQIELPQGYRVSRLPEPISFRNVAGAYTSEYGMQGSKLVVRRQLVVNKDVYTAQEYPELEALIYKPIQDFRDVVVLDKKS